MRRLSIVALLVISSCADGAQNEPSGETAFFDRLSTLCGGEAFAGALVSNDAIDADFQTASMTMGPAQCDGDMIRIPFAVEEDRSRTWEISRTEAGVRLKHDHRHKDGTEDVLTQYGGDSDGTGRAGVQNFPADDETKQLFTAEGIEVSNQNTWTVEIEPGTEFVYQMARPERLFRVEFDLTAPVETPPPTWGEAPIE